MSSSEVPPGWRHAQGDPPGTERYWDGSRWQGEPRPVGGSQEPPGAAPAATPRSSDPFAASSRPAASSGAQRAGAQPSGAQPSGGGGGPSVQVPFTSNDAKGFLSRLFDLSFQSFITTSIIKVLYILFIIFAGLGALSFIAFGFAANAGVGVLMLVISPLVFLLYVIMARVYLEIVIVLFRIHDQTAETARNTRK